MCIALWIYKTLLIIIIKLLIVVSITIFVFSLVYFLTKNNKCKNGKSFDYSKELKAYKDARKNYKYNSADNNFKWESVLCYDFWNSIDNKENYREFLCLSLKYKKDYVEILKFIVTPVSVAYITLFISDGVDFISIIVCVLSFVFLVFFVAILYCRAKQEIYFLDDMINTFFDNNSEPSIDEKVNVYNIKDLGDATNNDDGKEN